MKVKNVLACMLFLVLFMLVSMETNEASHIHEIKIERLLEKSGKCTIGKLYVGDVNVCYSMELPWKFNQSNVSCIPEGTYYGFLRFDRGEDRWRIQLEDVQGRKGIQIHIGNYPRETKGCILVGKTWHGKQCAIEKSKLAYKELKNGFYSFKDKRIKVIVTHKPGIRSEK